ncbi:hypothetical protein [Streptomyces sp. NBC_00829]|uniref:LmrA/YxaF family transcription factor n=1 Tax=Streptomyces sp. NBC_00829 TaxID=2903679 RepID=UPI00386BC9B0
MRRGQGDDVAARFDNGEKLLAESLRQQRAEPEQAVRLATLIVAAVEGAVALRRAKRSTEPLDRVRRPARSTRQLHHRPLKPVTLVRNSARPGRREARLGGQRQRLAIARALAVDPDCVRPRHPSAAHQTRGNHPASGVECSTRSA